MARTKLPRRIANLLSGSVLILASLAAAGSVAGCRVGSKDVKRWGMTEHGPDKLIAVVSHEKYDWNLRVEAGLELLTMKPRNGRRIGITRLVEAMALLSPEERKALVGRMAPTLVAQMKVPPPAAAGANAPADPSYPYKDAAMAMLTYDKAVLVADDAARKQLTDALIDWSQHDFERRIDNTTQMFGMEQMMRAIGPAAAKGLPALITPESTKFDRIATIVAELGDDATKQATAQKLVELAKYTASQTWVDKAKPGVEEANKVSKITASPAQLAAQLAQYQDEALTKVFAAIKKVGTRPAVDYCLGVGADKSQSEKRRQAALAALEGRLDRNNPGDVERILAIAAAEDTPDPVRDLAFQRVGEMPRDQVIGKLYTLFGAKKWKVRWVSASLVLTMSSTTQLAEFMSKLPPGPAAGFALTEPMTYGAKIEKMAVKDGKSPRDAVMAFLKNPSVAVRTTALGYFYANGKAADLPLVEPFRADKAPVPKVDDPEAKWQCEVPKADGKETEPKDIKTVGEFVQFCVEPAMKGR
jgi:hypothetical protein